MGFGPVLRSVVRSVSVSGLESLLCHCCVGGVVLCWKVLLWGLWRVWRVVRSALLDGGLKGLVGFGNCVVRSVSVELMPCVGGDGTVGVGVSWLCVDSVDEGGGWRSLGRVGAVGVGVDGEFEAVFEY